MSRQCLPRKPLKKWYVLDAAGKPLAPPRLPPICFTASSKAPPILPHVDCGDYVIIINARRSPDRLNSSRSTTVLTPAGGLKGLSTSA